MQSFQLGVWLQQYRIKNELGRKLLAEFAATFLLMVSWSLLIGLERLDFSTWALVFVRRIR